MTDISSYPNWPIELNAHNVFNGQTARAAHGQLIEHGIRHLAGFGYQTSSWATVRIIFAGGQVIPVRLRPYARHLECMMRVDFGTAVDPELTVTCDTANSTGFTVLVTEGLDETTELGPFVIWDAGDGTAAAGGRVTLLVTNDSTSGGVSIHTMSIRQLHNGVLVQ